MRFQGSPLCYLRDRKGKIWVGTTEGLRTFDHGKEEHYATGSVLALMEDRRGRVWAGTSKGLMEFCESGLRVISGVGGFPSVGIRAFIESIRGGYWIATNGSGLIRLRADPSPGAGDCETRYTAYTTGEGLGSNWVVNMFEDAEGIVWVTTPGPGLNAVRDGAVRRLGVEDGLPDQSFLNVAEDDHGYLWCSSNRGIYRFKKSDLVARVEGGKKRVTWTPFGIDDGMASSECNGGFQSAILKMSDGQLWFPTTAGVAVVRPGNLRLSEEPPPIVLQRVSMERQDVDLSKGTSVDHRMGELEFHYAGLFLSAPERVRYRFLLEGFDKEWVEAGARQTAFYTNIPPGVYRFRVMASVSEGVWSGIPVSATVTLNPRFFQTRWFLGLCVLVGASIVAGALALYRRDREREVQSSRLASELARAQLQVLEMQLQPHFLFNTLNSIMILIGKDPRMAEQTISRLADILRRSLDRGAVQEVTLREEIGFLDRYLDIERVRFGDRLTVERRLAPGVDDALVPTMLLQPLVENAIRHGVSARRGPARIEIDAARENGSLLLHVRDNGVGLKGTEVVTMGIGLSNTRERLRQLYGDRQQLRLESIPEGGVDVQVVIPFHKLSMQPWNRSGR
jgi:two-component sensor histidine kinase